MSVSSDLKSFSFFRRDAMFKMKRNFTAGFSLKPLCFSAKEQ